MKKKSILISVMLMVAVVLAVGDKKKSDKLSKGSGASIQAQGCSAKVPAEGKTNEEIQFQAYLLDDPPGDYTPGGLVSVDYVGETPVNMRFVPATSPNSFIQGSPSYEPGRDPDEDQFYHKLTRDLAGMETEVTVKMWDELKAMQPSLPDDPSTHTNDTGDTHPVHNVTWRECILFANLLSAENGFTQCYYTDSSKSVPIDASNYLTFTIGSIHCDFSANGYRLPTEGEWEYFCRAGTQGPFYILEPNYSNITKESCNRSDLPALASTAIYCGNSNGSRQPVREREANNWNLYDTLGNVAEWCWDGYSSYPAPGTTVTDYAGQDTSTDRVLRGGSWNDKPENIRCASRDSFSNSDRNNYSGFRLVRTLQL